uniref:Uncharacterized protein n=1 Tax=Oryza meridionalis TaxID=40149 RepID=A0A0E0DWJ7_9ORYZ
MSSSSSEKKLELARTSSLLEMMKNAYRVMVLTCAISRDLVLAATAAEAVHEVLWAHGLPQGLLPAGIADFRHDKGSRRFEAALGELCTAQFEVELRYKATVAWVISYSQITSLSGVFAQDLFLWFPICGHPHRCPFLLTVFEAPPPCTRDGVGRQRQARVEVARMAPRMTEGNSADHDSSGG